MPNSAAMPPDTPECHARHMGTWAVDFDWMARIVQRLKMGDNMAVSAEFPDIFAGEPVTIETSSGGHMLIREDGLALIGLTGPMQKGQSKWGGTSTVAMRELLRTALHDDRVKTLAVLADTPGGQVHGTQELSEQLAAVADTKPVLVHVEGTLASAGVWATAGASQIFAHHASEIGSIGVYAVLEDTSGAAERAGVRVIKVASGPRKGGPVDGKPITPEEVADVQASVDRYNSLFQTTLAEGRRLSEEQLAAVSDGQVFSAPDAVALGLIDGMMGRSEFLAMAAKVSAPQRSGSRLADARIRTARARSPKV